MPDLLLAALEYLDAGLPVMPVDDVSKKPLVAWKGLQTAMPTPEDWDVWFIQFPGAQLGLITGALAGIVVVEGDSPEAVEWIEAYLPYTPRRCRTRRGVHFYYRHPGWHVHNSAGKLAAHVDVRGDGGYVKVPPSANYTWDLDPSGADWADLPVFAMPVGVAEPGVIDLTHARLPEPRVPVNVSEGGRDNSLTRTAGSLARAGLDLQEILDVLGAVNRTYFPPVTDADLVRIAQSIHGAELRRRGPQQEPEPMRFRLRPAIELMNLPPVEWLIDGRLTRGGFSCVFGAPGSGKTFLALDMGLCVATGEHWDICTVVQGDVVYVAAEGSGGIGQRLRAWCDHRTAEPPTRFFGVTESVNLLEQSEVTQFILAIKSQSERPELVMVDTLAMCIPGGDENSSLDVGLAIACVKRIQRETGAHVMLIHHSSKGDPLKERGSGSLKAAVDTMIAVQDEGGVRTVICAKQKDAGPFGETKWALNPVGESCVLVLADQDLSQGIDLSGAKVAGAQKAEGPNRELNPNETRILEVIQAHPEGLAKSEVAKISDVNRTTCNSAVDRFVNWGLLAFSEETKRYTAIEKMLTTPDDDGSSSNRRQPSSAVVNLDDGSVVSPSSSVVSEEFESLKGALCDLSSLTMASVVKPSSSVVKVDDAHPGQGCPPSLPPPLGGVGREGAPGETGSGFGD